MLMRRLDLQAKIVLVLVAVILPTFLIVTVAENKFTQPILEEEMREVGITSGKTLAAEIMSARMLALPNPTPVVENALQELLYSRPNITRIDVFARDSVTGALRPVGSNIEEEPGALVIPSLTTLEAVSSEYRIDETGVGYWEIHVPIEQRARDPRGARKVLGVVHVVVSMKLVNAILGTIWKTTATAAAFTVVMLLLALSYFLRKTIANDRRLRQAETQNLELTEQLHEAQRQLMNTEKLAIMGQLTASFAHEIGTPLNAIGGHLSLLDDELRSGGAGPKPVERMGIIRTQLERIEQIVKNFLQSTSKPTSQKQLVDLNQVIEKTLAIVRPRAESLGVDIRRNLNRDLGPLRVVPLELEQILLNLVNNSLDSLQGKLDKLDRGKARGELELTSAMEHGSGQDWATLRVYDSGAGIKKNDLKKVLTPFFTTKPPGQGTGLGLTICQELAHKYGGMLEIESKEGAWARVTLRLPYLK
jgi:signal transduction histidine kinase